MKYLLLSLLIPMSSYANKTTCSYELEDKNYQINFSIKRNKAKLNIEVPGKTRRFKNCKVRTDDAGKIIDCSTRNTDLVVLINHEGFKLTGGLMSPSLNLIKELSCHQ